jgi:hypothetical protein
MSAQADLLAELRGLVAALHPARDSAATFIENTTNLAFEASPMAGADGFAVELGEVVPAEAFGNPGAYHVEQEYVVKLGHYPAGTEVEREVWRAADSKSVRELEFTAWSSGGVSAVFWTGGSVDKSDPNWWVSRVTFRAHLVESRS